MTDPSIPALMRHPVPRKPRRSPRPWSTTPPRCPECRAWLHPEHDESDCPWRPNE